MSPRTSFDVVGGELVPTPLTPPTLPAPVPDLSHVPGPAALSRKAAVEARLGSLAKIPRNREERRQLVAELDALLARLRVYKLEQHLEVTRHTFAGVHGSPLWEVVCERLPGLADELREAALARFDERQRKAAERKAAKTGGAT